MLRRSILVAVVALLAVAPSAPAAGWKWPVRGAVATVYENDNARPYAGGMHRGVDIAADVGTPVAAARSGTVTYAGALGSSGILVAMHDGRYVTSYLHLREVSVARGEHVMAGTRVGTVGTTGKRSVPEPHLHFGVRVAASDRYVDPLSLLPGFARERSVPAGPVVRRERRLVRHPVAAPAGARLPAAVPGHGRLLVLAGVGVVLLLLFGKVLKGLVPHRDPNPSGAQVRVRLRGLPRAWRACPARPGSLAPP